MGLYSFFEKKKKEKNMVGISKLKGYQAAKHCVAPKSAAIV
jgi:hypothetical protein